MSLQWLCVPGYTAYDFQTPAEQNRSKDNKFCFLIAEISLAIKAETACGFFPNTNGNTGVRGRTDFAAAGLSFIS